MKALALVVAMIIGLLLSTAISEADDEPPDTTVICPTDNPHCEEPWIQRPSIGR